MKSQLLKKALFLLFSPFLILSCNKSDEVSIDNNINPVIATNKLGMLKFNDNQEFHQTLNRLDKMDLGLVDKELAEYGFLSYQTDTLNDLKETGDFDPVLSRILNHHGAVQIGDSIVVFTPSKEYWIHENDTNTYAKMTQNKDFANTIIKTIDVAYLPLYINDPSKTINETNSSLKASNTSTHFIGSHTIFTPEENDGRPERIKFIIENRVVSGYNRFTFTAYGEAYRKGGLFGSRKWREEEINNLNYDFLQLKHIWTSNPEPPIYGLSRIQKTSVVFYTSQVIGLSAPTGVDQFDIKFNIIKMNSWSQNLTMRLTLSGAGGVVGNTLTLNKSW